MDNQTTEYISVTGTAKLVRQSLKRAFPGAEALALRDQSDAQIYRLANERDGKS